MKPTRRVDASGEKQYRAVVEDQFDLICRFLPDGALTFVNDAYSRFFGKQTREQSTGLKLFRRSDRTRPRSPSRRLPLPHSGSKPRLV